VERATAPIAPEPSDGVIVVGTVTIASWLTCIHICFGGVDAEQNTYSAPGVRPVHAKEFLTVIETLPSENSCDGVFRVIEFHPNMFVAVLMVGAASADHVTKLGPILDRSRPLGKRHRAAVHAQ